ncbi:Retrovirus-related Pol polyprotein from type-2 retrotransposable element R2DM [Varanus komodoensis]|nr:Retrovirus-related Pol polyprotein from type-2 retrotransposable element R2DM [Varanus komodoensis]
MWTEKYQKYRRDFEEAEELEIKLPTYTGSWRKIGSSKKIYFCFIDYGKAFDCVDRNKLWQVLKEMEVPDHLICLLRNLYAGQEATVRTGHGTTDWFKIEKGVRQDRILSSCLFNLYAEHMRKAELDEYQLELRLLGETSTTSDMQMIPLSWQKVKRN